MNLRPEILKIIVLGNLIKRDLYGKIISDERINYSYDSIYDLLKNYMGEEDFEERVDNLLLDLYLSDLICLGERDSISGQIISIKITAEGINYYKIIEQI